MSKYDAFISYSSKDWTVCFKLATRLRSDGIIVWLDRWMIRPGDNIIRSIEEGLTESRSLILLLSPNSVGSDWTEVERASRQFRDPANRERRFVPVLIEPCDLPETLKSIKHIDFCAGSDEAYRAVLAECTPPVAVLRSSEITTLVVRGDLTQNALSDSAWEEATSLWYDRLNTVQRRKVLVDLELCDCIDSSGVAFLFSLHKKARDCGASLAFCNASPVVKATFDVLRLSLIIPTFDTREAAVRHLANH